MDYTGWVKPYTLPHSAYQNFAWEGVVIISEYIKYLSFSYPQDKEPRGIIPLESLSVRECAEEQSRQFCFELFGINAEVIKACKTDKKTGKVMEGRHSVYKMSAATGEDMADWIKSIK